MKDQIWNIKLQFEVKNQIWWPRLIKIYKMVTNIKVIKLELIKLEFGNQNQSNKVRIIKLELQSNRVIKINKQSNRVIES